MKLPRRQLIRVLLIALPILPFIVGCAWQNIAKSTERLRQQVVETELALARTMATRDFDGFKSFLAEEAVFFSGDDVLRGRDKVAAEWRKYFEAEAAPFSWHPETVEVLETGDLALSSGPVLNAASDVIGEFNSIWRRQPGGEWKIVFDKGSSRCPGA